MFNILCQTATDSGGNGMGNLTSIVMILVIFAIFYFFMIRPQQKRQKQIQKMRDALGTGDKIVTAGGIHGVIREVGKTYFVVKVDEGVNLRIEKSSVYASAEDAQADQTQAQK